MTDAEFIQFLWKLLWNNLSGGNFPSESDLDILEEELIKRGIISRDSPIRAA